jgi:hypothetical protein
MSSQPLPLILTVQTGSQVGQIFPIRDGINSVGSDPDSDIFLFDPSVSSSHARIVKQTEGVYVQDLNSMGGTYVNGQRLTASVWLQPGDSLQIGNSIVLGVQTSQPGFVQAPAALQPRRPTKLWIAATIISVLIIAGLVAGGWWLFAPSITVASLPPPGPSVLIITPKSDDVMPFNEPSLIHARIRDEQRVSYAELWVDDQHIATQQSALPEGMDPFTFAPFWTPLATGKHTFFVRAFSTDGRAGESGMITLIAKQERVIGDKLFYVVQRGDTLQGIALKVDRPVEEIYINNQEVIDKLAVDQKVAPEEVKLPPGEELVVPMPANAVQSNQPQTSLDQSTISPPTQPNSTEADLVPASVSSLPPPQIISANNTAGCQVTLSWTASQGNAGYYIYKRYSDSPSLSFVQQVEAHQTSLTDSLNINRNGVLYYTIAALDSNGTPIYGSEQPVSVDRCGASVSTAKQAIVELVDIQPPNLIGQIYCYIIHTNQDLQTTASLQQDQPQAVSLGQSLGSFPWDPAHPLRLQFACFDRSVTPHRFLGLIGNTFSQGDWQDEHTLPFLGFSNTAKTFFSLSYRLCLETCPPLEKTSTEYPKIGLPLKIPAPTSLHKRTAGFDFDCPLQARFSIGFSNCFNPPPGYQVLLWDWTPAVSGQEVWSFEVWQKVYKANQPANALTGPLTTVEVAVGATDGQGFLGALVPDISKNLGCGEVADIYVRAVGPAGRSEESEPLSPPVTGPPCRARVTVTFDTLRASDVNDGWFGLNDDMETTGWVVVNDRDGKLQKRQDINEGSTYHWSDLNLSPGPAFTVELDNRDDLTIEAQLFDNDEGRWCYQSLALPARPADQWAKLKNVSVFLEDRKRYSAAKCKIGVIITGEEIIQ